jgi:hypothetical protein
MPLATDCRQQSMHKNVAIFTENSLESTSLKIASKTYSLVRKLETTRPTASTRAMIVTAPELAGVYFLWSSTCVK